MDDPGPPIPALLLQALLELTQSSPPSQLQFESGALFARLKSLNRATNAAIRSHKQRTADARLAMDQTHLHLQNLLYERRHLEREIEKCNQFASIYQDIPLHTIEEFTELAPDEAKTSDVFGNEHQLMLNRLSFELAERQRLEEKRRSLVADKEAKMKQARANEKLVNEWFSGGTGLERAVADLQSMGTKVASKLGLKTSLSSRDPSPTSIAISPSPSMTMSEPPATSTPPVPPPSIPHIPTGPRVRT